MTAFFHFTPDHRDCIAKVESLRALREVKHQWRAHYRSLPAAESVCVTPSLRNLPVAGTYSVQGEVA